MTISEKSKTIDSKIEQKRLILELIKAQNTFWTDKLLRFQLYQQEMLVNMNF